MLDIRSREILIKVAPKSWGFPPSEAYNNIERQYRANINTFTCVSDPKIETISSPKTPTITKFHQECLDERSARQRVNYGSANIH
jgi:hypothetical protein